MKKTAKIIFSAIIISAAVLLDQAAKLLVRIYLEYEEWYQIIPNVLDFRYTKNSGAAFGMFSSVRWLFISLTIIIVLVLLAYLFFKTPKSNVLLICLSLIAGGGIGNLIDRLAFREVVDFISCKWVDKIIPPSIFNVADICVVVGTTVLAIWLLFSKSEPKTPAGEMDRQVTDAENSAFQEGAAQNCEDCVSELNAVQNASEPALEADNPNPEESIAEN